jgi:hypothetical protein
MDLNFGFAENAEEVGSGGVSPFIEAPCYTLSYPDPDSFKQITSKNKGTLGIEFFMVEAAVTEGVDKEQYGGRRKCKVTLYFSEKSWNNIVRPFISKLGEHYYGIETANRILKACQTAYQQTGSLEGIRNALVDIFKKVFAPKTAAFFLYSGQASYKAKDDNSGYWRSVYPNLNTMSTTVRPNTPQGKAEMEEYFQKHKASLLEDTGEPSTISNNGTGLQFNTGTDLGDFTTTSGSGSDEDWGDF